MLSVHANYHFVLWNCFFTIQGWNYEESKFPQWIFPSSIPPTWKAKNQGSWWHQVSLVQEVLHLAHHRPKHFAIIAKSLDRSLNVQGSRSIWTFMYNMQKFWLQLLLVLHFLFVCQLLLLVILLRRLFNILWDCLLNCNYIQLHHLDSGASDTCAGFPNSSLLFI